MIKVEKRASTVLYKFLISNCKDYHFILPANVCPVVPLTFIKAGINFSFVDIDSRTHAGDVSLYLMQVKLYFKDKRVGILYVNSYGCLHDTTQFYIELKRLNSTILIIEDNCLCVPEIHRFQPKEHVDLELYSTGYSKVVSLSNGGGFGIIRDNCLYLDYHAPYNEAGYVEQYKKIIESANKMGGGLLFIVRTTGYPRILSSRPVIRYQNTSVR